MAYHTHSKYINSILERMPFILGDGYRLRTVKVSPVIYVLSTPLGRTIFRGTYSETEAFLDGVLYKKRES